MIKLICIDRFYLNMILGYFNRRKYTYPVISRIRKRSADTLLKDNDFDVKLSQYNWGKNQGSSNIGSSSGIDSDQYAKFHMSEYDTLMMFNVFTYRHGI
jgi:hypothetical protein